MLEIKNERIAIPIVLFAGLLWSFGPLVVRYMDQPNLNPWQYLFTRGIVIFIILNIYLFFLEGKNFYKNYFNISIAVGTEKGLVVPVVKNADELSFADIEKNIKILSEKATSGNLSIEDLQGGTFTISNGGVFGSLLSTPILNAPQTAILGMHKIQDRPIVIDGKIEIRPMMYLALSYDHRLLDGKDAVSFLISIKEQLEKPERLLLNL